MTTPPPPHVPSLAPHGRAGDVAIRAHAVSKLFATVPALVRLDLEVAAGTLVAVIGGNGAGKTTLLRLLATALRPTSGSLEILGHDATRATRAVRAATEYVASAGGAYPELSGRENLRFAATMRGLDIDASDIDRALARAGLTTAADERARGYSSGMLQRLALARLALWRPCLALLDEPYANLDHDGRALVDELVAELLGSGATVIFATHQRERGLLLAGRMVELRQGLLSEGSALGGAPFAVGAVR